MTDRAKLIEEVHGAGNCHICGKPKIAAGSSTCSYPHGMMPIKAVDHEHPDGFWTWGHAHGDKDQSR